MTLKDDLKIVYLDNSVIEPWFEGLMTDKKELLTSKFIEFLLKRKDIIKYIPNLKILEDEISKNGQKGLFISAEDLLAFTTKIGSVKDAIHVCLAKHENCYFVTKDDKVGKVQLFYPKTIGMGFV